MKWYLLSKCVDAVQNVPINKYKKVILDFKKIVEQKHLLYRLLAELHNNCALCHHEIPKFEENLNCKSGGNKYFKIGDSSYVMIELCLNSWTMEMP